MFMIWYTLFSILYLFTTIFYVFFSKILKLDKSIFEFIFNKLNIFFNFYNSINLLLKNTKTSNLNSKSNSLHFKNFYTEATYFSNKKLKINARVNNFENSIVFCILNNKLLTNLATYSFSLNYIINTVINTNSSKLINSKKANLLFFSNKVAMLNSNLTALTSTKFDKSYLSYKKNLLTNSNVYVNVSEKLTNLVNNSWVIKFSPSNFIKYIDHLNINTYSILYLRKAKVFNKGRYSRNRQYYRTGVYWCLYVNIIAVVGIYFWFYRFTMNFGYLWWLLFAFILSFIAPKAIKYRLYNPKKLINSIVDDLVWVGNLVLSVKSLFKNISDKGLSVFINYYLNTQFFSLNSTINSIKSSINYYFNTLSYLKLIGNNSFVNNVIYKWEFSNTNYYYNSIMQSKPIVLEKIKQYWLGLISIIFLTK